MAIQREGSQSLAEIAGQAVGLTILIGPGILVWQAYVWLRYGHWQPIVIRDAFAYFDVGIPYIKWVGVQRMVDSVLEWPLSVTTFVAAIFLTIGSMIAAVWLYEVFVDFIDLFRKQTPPRR